MRRVRHQFRALAAFAVLAGGARPERGLWVATSFSSDATNFQRAAKRCASRVRAGQISLLSRACVEMGIRSEMPRGRLGGGVSLRSRHNGMRSMDEACRRMDVAAMLGLRVRACRRSNPGRARAGDRAARLWPLVNACASPGGKRRGGGGRTDVTRHARNVSRWRGCRRWP